MQQLRSSCNYLLADLGLLLCKSCHVDQLSRVRSTYSMRTPRCTVLGLFGRRVYARGMPADEQGIRRSNIDILCLIMPHITRLASRAGHVRDTVGQCRNTVRLPASRCSGEGSTRFGILSTCSVQGRNVRTYVCVLDDQPRRTAGGLRCSTSGVLVGRREASAKGFRGSADRHARVEWRVVNPYYSVLYRSISSREGRVNHEQQRCGATITEPGCLRCAYAGCAQENNFCQHTKNANRTGTYLISGVRARCVAYLAFCGEHGQHSSTATRRDRTKVPGCVGRGDRAQYINVACVAGYWDQRGCSSSPRGLRAGWK